MSNIIFIHGMFQNDKSWNKWASYFSSKGHHCFAEPWPMHEGEPSALRKNPPPRLGDLRLDEVIDKMSAFVRKTDKDAVLIGHSVGGLIVQHLVNQGLGSKGVCISSVAPNKMLSLDWGFFKNSISIANPFKGDEPFYMTPEGFHSSFCNTMSEQASDKAYEATATHDSRNVLRDCMMEAGEIELKHTHKHLLFIGGEKDQIIPAALNEKNAKAYKEGLAEFKQFENRGHFICGQPGWEEVADYVSHWMQKTATPAAKAAGRI